VDVTGAKGYILYDWTSESAVVITSLSPGTSHYAVSGLSSGSTYTYRVRMMDCDGLRWTAMDCDGLRWTAMDCDGLLESNTVNLSQAIAPLPSVAIILPVQGEVNGG
jgi:hypothetical protein